MTETFQHGYALVVGIGGDLPITVQDACGVAEILRDQKRCAYPEQQVHLLTGEKAQRDAVLSGLDLLANQAQADQDATVIVFFSGHGIEVPDYYLLPYAYNLVDLPGSAISSQEFTRKLKAIESRKLIVFLDCCHAAGMAEVKGVPIAKSPLPPTMISELSVGSGRVIIASSHKDEYSFVGDPFSVFTSALIGITSRIWCLRTGWLRPHSRCSYVARPKCSGKDERSATSNCEGK